MFAKEKYIMGTSIQYHITRAFKEDLGEIFRSMSNDGISEMVVNSLSGKVEELKKANVDEVTSLFLPGIKIRYKKTDDEVLYSSISVPVKSKEKTPKLPLILF